MAPAAAELADAADALATIGRNALVHLRGQQLDLARSEIAAGDRAVAGMATLVASVTAARRTLLDGTTLASINTTNQDRAAQIDAAITAAGGLPGSWARLAAAAPAPLTVLETLAAHDKLVVQATDAARTSDWTTALRRLSDAAGSAGRVAAISAQLKGKGLDVTTLDGWVARLDRLRQRAREALHAARGVARRHDGCGERSP